MAKFKDHTKSEGWNLTKAERKRIKKQRGKRFFSTHDMWNLDTAICAALGNGLILLRDASMFHLDEDEINTHIAALHAYVESDYSGGFDQRLADAQEALMWIAINLPRLWD